MRTFRLQRRDVVVIALVLLVVVVLQLGVSERRTRPTPDDATHVQARTRAECVNCHGPQGSRPWPAKHTQADQCFQCHQQPKGWKK